MTDKEKQDDLPEDAEGLTAPTSSDVGQQTLTKADLGGRDVTTDAGALEEALERGKEALADDLSSPEDAEGFNTTDEVVENPPDARITSTKKTKA